MAKNYFTKNKLNSQKYNNKINNKYCTIEKKTNKKKIKKFIMFYLYRI